MVARRKRAARRGAKASYGTTWTARDKDHVRRFLAGEEVPGPEPVTPETALTLPVYMACLRIISQTPCLLPFEMREALERGNRPLPDHRLTWFLNNPHPWMTKFSFWQLLLQWAAGWGLGMAEIVWDSRGDPLRMTPMHPGSVEAFVMGGELWWHWRYRDAETRSFEERDVPDSRVFRIHGMGGDGVTGYSAIRYAAAAIGQGLAHQSYGSDFFANGVWGSGTLETPQTLKPESKEQLQKTIDSRFAGSGNRFRALLLDGGMKWSGIDIPNSDAQLVEFGNFNAYQVTRAIGVQPHKVGLLEGAKYKNIEEENIAWTQDGVMPWTMRIEEEAQKKLLFRPGKLYVHINLKGLLRGDFATRFDAYQKRLNTGTMSPNDVREIEDEKLIAGPEGDAYYMQGANKSLKDIFDPPEPPKPAPQQVGPAPEPEPEPEQPEPEPAEAKSPGFLALAETQRPHFAAVVRALLRRESKMRAGKAGKLGPDALKKWCDDWIDGQRSRVEADFRPPMACVSMLAERCGTTAGSLTGFLETWHEQAKARTEVDDSLAGPLTDAAFSAAVNGAAK